MKCDLIVNTILVTFFICTFARADIDLEYCTEAPPCEAAKNSVELLECTLTVGFGYGKQMNKSLSCCYNNSTKDIKWYFAKEYGATFSLLDSTDSTFRNNNTDNRHIITHEVKPTDDGLYRCSGIVDGVIRNRTIRFTYFNTKPARDWLYQGFTNNVEPIRKTIYSSTEEVVFWNAAVVVTGKPEVLNFINITWEMSQPNFKFTNRSYKYMRGGRSILFSSISLSKFNIEKLNDTIHWFAKYVKGGQLIDYLNMTYQLLGSPANTQPRAILISIACTVIIILLCVLVVYLWLNEIRLFFKDRCMKLEINDECLWDIFICYNPEESSNLVANFLLPKIENELGYSCFAFERDSLCGEYLPVTLPARVPRCRRLLIVLTPGLLRNVTAMHVCQTALPLALSDQPFRIIVVWPPKQQRQQILEIPLNDTLTTILNAARSVTLPPQDESNNRKIVKFWTKLRLGFPPLFNQAENVFSNSVSCNKKFSEYVLYFKIKRIF